MSRWRVLAHILVGAFLVGMFALAITPPAWEKQFKATGDSLQNAKSFRLAIVTTRQSGEKLESIEEVNCPGEYHVIRRHYDATGAIAPYGEFEAWSVGGRYVIRTQDGVREVNMRSWDPSCGTKRLLELMDPDTEPFFTYEVILMRGKAERGGKKTVQGESCREWTVQLPHGGGWGEVYTVCIAESNLPLEVVTRGRKVVAHVSHWNEPIELPQAPEPPVGTTN